MVENTIQRIMSDIEKRRNRYYSNFTFKGQRIRRTLRTTDPEEARRNCDKLRAELWEEERKPVSERYTFTDAVGAWLATGKKDLSDKYRINSFGLEDVPLADITEKSLSTLLERYQGATRNRVINLLTAIFNCAVRKEWITAVPHMERVKKKKLNKGFRWLTGDEWEALQKELPTHLLHMARFAVYTGLRENNVIGLEWKRVDLRRKVVWIPPHQTKGGEAIGVPLNDDAIATLKAQIGKDKRYVFVYERDTDEGKKGAPVTKTSTKAWKAALVRAEIDVVEKEHPVCKSYPKGGKYLSSTFRWHDLRHTFASWHVMNGTPLEVLQKLGGWESLEMVQRYAHLAPDHVAQFAGNVRPISLQNAVDNSEIDTQNCHTLHYNVATTQA
jgi:integrase